MGKTLIIGMGISGQAAAKLLLTKGHSVIGVDSRHAELGAHLQESISQGLKLQSDKEPIFFGDIDLVVVSPGISVKHPLYIAAKGENKKILTEIELGCHYLSNQRIIGVTGTNGKTTVTLLIEHILKFTGNNAIALGNVGLALCSKVLDLGPDDIVVLELSSYQLESLDKKILDVGLLLNITPDHLDRYGTMEAYAKAKANMQKCIKDGGLFLAEENTFAQFSSCFQKNPLQLFGYQASSHFSTDLEKMYFPNGQSWELPANYKGKRSLHLENLLAASSACFAMGILPSEVFQSLATFSLPNHRIQFVRELHGVAYYDDSKGTNVEAVKRAVEILPNSIILIAGGVDKGESYSYWREAFQNKVKCICAIGQAKEKIKADLQSNIEVLTFNDLKEAVIYASSIAKRQDSILLSPGCSSFDMFRDYAHRGKEFQNIVNSLV